MRRSTCGGRSIDRRPLAAALLRCAVLLACALLLASCAQGEAHLTIRRDGSADLDIGASVDTRTLGLIGKPELMRDMADALRKQGMDVTAEDGGGRSGLRATRRLDLRDMAERPLDLPDGIEVERTEKQHFYYTRNEVAVSLDMDRLLQENAADLSERIAAMPQLAKTLLQSQLRFDFLLTFPLKPGANNADETRDGGRTLVWHMDLLGENRFETSFAVPNLRHIALTAGPALLLLAAAVLYAVRRRRRRG